MNLNDIDKSNFLLGIATRGITHHDNKGAKNMAESTIRQLTQMVEMEMSLLQFLVEYDMCQY